MAKADIWMPLYIGDYLADTMGLNTEQHGAYMLLLMAYWKNGGALPNDDAKLATITRLSADAWSMHKHTLASYFDVESDPSLWIHVRAEKEMDRAGNNQEKRTLRAKTAAEARWGKNATSNAQAMLKPCPSPSPSPSKEKQDQKPCSSPSAEHVEFDQFWKLYPRKVGKQTALKAWEKLKPDMILFAEIEKSLELAKRSPDWLKSAGQFIPHPSVWLNGRRWEDEQDPSAALPFEQIGEAYNEICGKVFKPCEVMTPDRMLLVRGLAAQEFKGRRRFIEGGMEYWRRFFTAAASSRRWAGDNPSGFVADFDHVIRNAAVVFEASQ